MAETSLPDSDPSPVTTHTDRVCWLVDLLQDDTIARSGAVDDPGTEAALLDIARRLRDAGKAVRQRHRLFLDTRGE